MGKQLNKLALEAVKNTKGGKNHKPVVVAEDKEFVALAERVANLETVLEDLVAKIQGLEAPSNEKQK